MVKHVVQYSEMLFVDRVVRGLTDAKRMFQETRDGSDSEPGVGPGTEPRTRTRGEGGEVSRGRQETVGPDWGWEVVTRRMTCITPHPPSQPFPVRSGPDPGAPDWVWCVWGPRSKIATKVVMD